MLFFRDLCQDPKLCGCEISSVEAETDHPCFGAEFDIVDPVIFQIKADCFIRMGPVHALQVEFGGKKIGFEPFDFVGFLHRRNCSDFAGRGLEVRQPSAALN